MATTRNQALTFKNLFNRIFGFQPVIEIKNTENIDEIIKTFNLGVEFKGLEMLDCLKRLWAEALAMLGITAETTKKERLIEGEITLNRQEDNIGLNARLLNRLDFCNKMNKEYGLELSVNLSSEIEEARNFTAFGGDDLGEMDNLDS